MRVLSSQSAAVAALALLVCLVVVARAADSNPQVLPPQDGDEPQGRDLQHLLLPADTPELGDIDLFDKLYANKEFLLDLPECPEDSGVYSVVFSRSGFILPPTIPATTQVLTENCVDVNVKGAHEMYLSTVEAHPGCPKCGAWKATATLMVILERLARKIGVRRMTLWDAAMLPCSGSPPTDDGRWECMGDYGLSLLTTLNSGRTFYEGRGFSPDPRGEEFSLVKYRNAEQSLQGLTASEAREALHECLTLDVDEVQAALEPAQRTRNLLQDWLAGSSLPEEEKTNAVATLNTMLDEGTPQSRFGSWRRLVKDIWGKDAEMKALASSYWAQCVHLTKVRQSAREQTGEPLYKVGPGEAMRLIDTYLPQYQEYLAGTSDGEEESRDHLGSFLRWLFDNHCVGGEKGAYSLVVGGLFRENPVCGYPWSLTLSYWTKFYSHAQRMTWPPADTPVPGTVRGAPEVHRMELEV